MDLCLGHGRCCLVFQGEVVVKEEVFAIEPADWVATGLQGGRGGGQPGLCRLTDHAGDAEAARQFFHAKREDDLLSAEVFLPERSASPHGDFAEMQDDSECGVVRVAGLIELLEDVDDLVLALKLRIGPVGDEAVTEEFIEYAAVGFDERLTCAQPITGALNRLVMPDLPSELSRIDEIPDE